MFFMWSGSGEKLKKIVFMVVVFLIFCLNGCISIHVSFRI